MKPRTIAILYWIFIPLFAAMLLMDGISGLMQMEEGKAAMKMLGYPNYLMNIVGVAKILAAIALLQPKFRLLKEWAFAGLTINFLGASASWYFSGVMEFIFPPLIMLVVMILIYRLWKAKERSVLKVER